MLEIANRGLAAATAADPGLVRGLVAAGGRCFRSRIAERFGVADLYGKSLRQRAEQLIAVAHPDLRPELRAFARGRMLIH